MNRPPYRPDESLFTRGVGRQIIWIGLLVALLSILAGYFQFIKESSSAAWQTMIFTTLTFCQMQFALSSRSPRISLFRMNQFTNKPLLFTVLLTFVLQLSLIYTPFFQMIFKTTALTWTQLGVCFALSLSIHAAVEIEKILVRWSEKRSSRHKNSVERTIKV
jgi:Ca2+-transporting ATPase